MLCITLMKAKPNTSMLQRRERRLDWRYPEGMRVLGEYWLATSDPSVISIAEADDAGVIRQAMAHWDDLFEYSVFPAVTAEQGIAEARRQLATAHA